MARETVRSTGATRDGSEGPERGRGVSARGSARSSSRKGSARQPAADNTHAGENAAGLNAAPPFASFDRDALKKFIVGDFPDNEALCGGEEEEEVRGEDEDTGASSSSRDGALEEDAAEARRCLRGRPLPSELAKPEAWCAGAQAQLAAALASVPPPPGP